MFHPFVSSHRPYRSAPGTAALSVLAHAGLIALAVSGREAKPVREVRGGAVERVTFATPAVESRYLEPRNVRRAGQRARRARKARSPLDNLAMLHLNVAVATEPQSSLALEVDFDGLATRSIDFGGAPTSSLAKTVLGAVDAVRMIGDAYADWVVEKVAAAREGNPIPEYPERLRRSGIEGDLVVHFVVDSTGRVDQRDIRFPVTAHRLFAESVRRSLIKSRYLPAELGGRRVRQHVSQQFIFKIVR